MELGLLISCPRGGEIILDYLDARCNQKGLGKQKQEAEERAESGRMKTQPALLEGSQRRKAAASRSCACLRVSVRT